VGNNNSVFSNNKTMNEAININKVFKLSAICAGLMFSAVSLQAADVSDYQQTFERGLFGDEGNGNRFNLSSNGVQHPGDKITSVKMYFTKKTIEGIEVRYRFGETAIIGRTTTDKTRTMHLDDDEYITTWKFTRRKSDEISRVYLETNKGFRKKFGEGNVKGQIIDSLECGIDTGNNCENKEAVIGFYGDYNGDAIQSLGVVSNKILQLEEVGTRLGEFQQGMEQSGFLSSNVGANSTALEQSSQIRTTYTKTNTVTDKWSNTLGISATLGYKTATKASVVGVGDISTEVSFSITSSLSNTIGQDKQEGETESITVVNDLKVAPYEIYAYNVVTYHSTGEQEYITTYRNPLDGSEFDFVGKVEVKSYSDNFVRWLDVGNVDPVTGDINIDDEYQSAYGHYESRAYNVAPTSSGNSNPDPIASPGPNRFRFESDQGNQVRAKNNRTPNLFSGKKRNKFNAFKNKNGRIISSVKRVRVKLNDDSWVMSKAEEDFRRANNLSD